MKFNKGDLVYSIKGDKTISAVVDFETDDGKVYISPRGKGITYPERLILNKDLLFKKEGMVYKISKSDVNTLMDELLNICGDIDKEPVKEIGTCIYYLGNKCKVVEILDNGDLIFEKESMGLPNSLMILSDKELQRFLWTKEDIINQLYGLKLDEVELID